MARINTRQVEAFRAVMLTGGMTSAAEFLSITQPAVSRLVRDFERAVGLDLFERRSNAVVPTSDARLLLSEVERSFVGLGRIGEMAQAIRGQAAGSLRIAALPALATSVLPRFVGRFLRDRPNLAVTIQAMPSYLVLEAIASGKADFGYAIGPFDLPGIAAERLRAPAVAILPEGHRLARRASLAPADFAGERFVQVGSGTLFQARLVSAFAEVERLTRVETTWSETACVLVCEGAGVSVVDPYSASEFAGRGLVARRFEPEIDMGIVFLRLPNRPVTPLERTFTDGFRAEIARYAGG